MFLRYSDNDPEGTVNKLHQRRYVQKSEVLRFHHGIFPFKHKESNDANKVLVDINEDSLVTIMSIQTPIATKCCFISVQNIPKKC